MAAKKKTRSSPKAALDAAPKAAVKAAAPAGEQTLLDGPAVAHALDRMCRQIQDHLPGDCPVALIGLRSRGDELALRLLKCLSRKRPDLQHGTLDITLYRDDVSKRAVQPTVRASEIAFDLDNACVILVDDVLHTGRTIRAAMAALMDYGRPAIIRLAVLVDRGGRELPIAPDFVGQTLALPAAESRRVYLELSEIDGRDRVYLK